MPRCTSMVSSALSDHNCMLEPQSPVSRCIIMEYPNNSKQHCLRPQHLGGLGDCHEVDEQPDDQDEANMCQAEPEPPSEQHQSSSSSTSGMLPGSPRREKAAPIVLLGDIQKLYDRETEAELLQQAYQEAARTCCCIGEEHDNDHSKTTSSVVIITGASGLGKTALARSLEPTVQQDGGWFLYGKCDQIENQVVTEPFAPFAEAFSQLVDQVLQNEQRQQKQIQIQQTTATPIYNKSHNNNNHAMTIRKRLQQAILDATQDTTSVHVLTDAIPAFKKAMVSLPSFQRHTGGSTSTLLGGSYRDGAVAGGHSNNNCSTRSLVRQPSEAFNLAAATSGTTIMTSCSNQGGDGPIHRVFCKFLEAFCSPESPLVLFLDDLQWLDSSSIALFAAVAKEQANIPGFFLMGTCRGNEVSYQSPLAQVLRAIEDHHHVSIREIAVGNLTIEALVEMVKDLFHNNMSESLVKQVADVVFHQTRGNSFFALQVLRNMVDTKVLCWDENSQQWVWPLPERKETKEEQNQQEHLPSTVNKTATTTQLDAFPSELDCVTLCTNAIAILIQQEQQERHDCSALGQVLMVASCLGTEFSHTQIEAGALLESGECLDSALQVLQNRGMLCRRQDTCSTILLQSTKVSGKVSFRWTHDRFQQVAYALIPNDKRVDFHVSVGLNLLRRSSPFELQNHPFGVVHQFCRHPSPSNIQFQSDNERTQLVALCLAAGERAALSSAFETATIYLRLGLEIVGSPTSFFESHYDLSLNLFNAAAEMECCMGNFDKVDELVETIIDNTTSFEQQLRAYETHIYSLSSRQDLDGAIRLGLKVLRQLGVIFPRKIGMLSVVANVFKTKYRLARVAVEDIMNLKPLNNWKKSGALRVMHLLFPPCLRNNVNLSVLLATRAIEITLRHGLSEMSCIGFGAFGILLCNPLGWVDEGIRIIRIGEAIQELLDAKSMKCRTILTLYGFSLCWKAPLYQCIQPLQQGAQIGFLSGDVEMACLSLYCSNCASFSTGANLQNIEGEIAELHEQFSLRHQENFLFYLKVSQQTVQNLLGSAENTSLLVGDFFDEATGLQHAREMGDVAGVAVVLLFQALLAVYFNDTALCRRVSKEFSKCSLQALNAALIYQAHFVGGLAEVLGARSKGKRCRTAGKMALKNLKKFAVHAPENVLNKIHLIEAEKCVSKGRREKALANFQLSIDHAKDQKLVHEEGLAYERAGLALLGWGESTTGLSFLEKARTLYQVWGSHAKVEQLSSMMLNPADKSYI